MTTSGVSFTQATGYYDETRALPDDVMRRMIRMLYAELYGMGSCLEVGAGTGRMLVPLAEAGLRVCGIDLSLPMLLELRAKMDLPITQASATALPFSTGSFGSAVACLALHVIPDWQAVVDEVMRVVVPGGVFLVQPPWSWDTEIAGKVRRYFAERVGLAKPVPGVLDMALLDRYCAGRGMQLTELPVLHFSSNSRTILEVLEQLQSRQNSWTWNIPSADMERGIAETSRWAEDTFGSLSEPRDMQAPIQWRKYLLSA